jgi:putative ABC transport system substrate-binding protein
LSYYARAVFALAVAVVFFAPAAGQAQSKTPPRVGILSPFLSSGDTFRDSLQDGLRELGYVQGRSVAIEYRSSEGMADRLPALASELVRLRIDVIVTTSPPGVQAAQQATRSIPIVIGGVDDAVEQGFVASLGRPGGNITGASWLNTELNAKRMQFLKDALPGVSRIAVLREAVAGATSLRAAEDAARSLNLRLQVIEVRTPGEIDGAFSAMMQERVGALMVFQGPMTMGQQRAIVELALRNRLPTIFTDRSAVEAGGLLSYGPRMVDVYRHAAGYVDRILRGAAPGALPVEQPTQFELFINVKTAKALGITIPPSLLLRADALIE